MWAITDTDYGGKDFAKELLSASLETFGGCNLRFLETATGLPQYLLKALLLEMEAEGTAVHAGACWECR